MVDNLVENSSNQNNLDLKHLNHHVGLLGHNQTSKLVTGDSDNTSGTTIDNRLKVVQNVSFFIPYFVIYYCTKSLRTSFFSS